MRPPKYLWADTPSSRGIFLFAQLLSEMLTATTFESFRVYSLDTVSRLDEALSLIGDIQSERLPKVALEPVLAELHWSLSKDRVAQEAATLEIDAFSALTPASPLEDVRAHIFLLKRLISTCYKVELERKLVSTCSDPNKRSDFRQLCAFYCSNLINFGYSKSYVRSIVESELLNKQFSDVQNSTLQDFLGLFDGVKQECTVYAAVSYAMGKFLKSLDYTVLDKKLIPPNVSVALSAGTGFEEYHDVYVIKVNSYDCYGAMLLADQTLIATRALIYLSPGTMPCQWDPSMYCQTSDEAIGRIQKKNTTLFGGIYGESRNVSGRRMRRTRDYSNIILHNFNSSSKERFLSSIETATLARTSANSENQLISLWSAIEVLLSEPGTGSARIVHYRKLLIPCICMRHIRRQLIAVCEELLVIYRKGFSAIINQEAGGYDQHTAFAAILLLAENDHLRNELLKLCKDNPLALHRLWRLNRDLSSPNTLFKTIAEHESRVSWQVDRIYRCRNNLVHAGRVPSFLESVISNLVEYYQAAVTTIVRRAPRDGAGSGDIDQIVAEIGIQYSIYKRYFQAGRKAIL